MPAYASCTCVHIRPQLWNQFLDLDHASLSLMRSRLLIFCCAVWQNLQKIVQNPFGLAKPVIQFCHPLYAPQVIPVPLSPQCRTSCKTEPSSISDVFEPVSSSTSNQSKTAQSTMTVSTITITHSDVSYYSVPSVVPTTITTDANSSPLITHSPTTTTRSASPITAAENTATTAAASLGHGLSNSKLTAIIVVPIVLLAILSPILIVWFLSRRRRRRHRSHDRRSIPKDVKFEKEKEKNTVGSPPQARQLRSSPPKRNAASLPPPPRRSFKTTPVQRGSTQQLRTSQIPNNSFSGFNFDISPRGTVFSAHSTQQTIRDPGARPSSTYTWILPPPSASRPMTLARPYIPPRIQTPELPGSPLAPQPHDHTSKINPEISSQPTTEELTHPNSYGKVHARASSNYSLSVENLSFHNGSNLQAPFSYQPHLDAVSDISGLSFDHRLWVATQQPQRDPDVTSEIGPNSSINPHQII